MGVLTIVYLQFSAQFSDIDSKDRTTQKPSNKRIEKIREKATRILNFIQKTDPMIHMFKSPKIMKMRNIVIFNNFFLFMIKLMEFYLPTLTSFLPPQIINTHIIQGVEKIILLLKHHLSLLHMI